MPDRQMTLSEAPLSHREDPQTSYDAADKMIKSGKLTLQEKQVMKAIISRTSRFALNFTARELSRTSGYNYWMIQRRLSGLRNKGKIERLNTEGGVFQEGRGQKLMKRNNCAVWRLT